MKLLTTSDVAKRLNLSPDMVRYLERTGKLPAERVTRGRTRGGQRLFREDDVERVRRARLVAKGERIGESLDGWVDAVVDDIEQHASPENRMRRESNTDRAAAARWKNGNGKP